MGVRLWTCRERRPDQLSAEPLSCLARRTEEGLFREKVPPSRSSG